MIRFDNCSWRCSGAAPILWVLSDNAHIEILFRFNFVRSMYNFIYSTNEASLGELFFIKHSLQRAISPRSHIPYIHSANIQQ